MKYLTNSSITFSLIDVTLLKWSSILFGMIVGAFIPEYIKQNIWFFAFLVLLFAIKPGYTYLTRNKNRTQN